MSRSCDPDMTVDGATVGVAQTMRGTPNRGEVAPLDAPPGLVDLCSDLLLGEDGSCMRYQSLSERRGSES